MKMFEIPDTEALRFTRNLKAGWNLGNTFDAYDNNNSSLGLRLESYWCGVKTPKELFRILKASRSQFKVCWSHTRALFH